MDALPVSAAAARRFLVRRHLLAPPRALPAGLDGVRAVFARLGSIQFDPLAVAGRNHDLVLHARVRDYDPAWTNALLYERRELFETYNKMLSLLPTERAALVPPGLGPLPGRAPRRRLRPPSPRRSRTSSSASGTKGPCAASTSSGERHDRLVLGTHQRGARRPGGPFGGGRHRPRPARGQPPLLRPRRAPLPGRAAGSPARRARAAAATSSSRATAPTACWARAARPSSGTASPRPARAPDRSAGDPDTPGAARGARGRRRPAGRWPSRACAAPATSWAKRPAAAHGRSRDRGRHPARRTGRGPSSRRSTPSSGTATCCAASSASTTSGRSTCRRRSGAGATTSCRSSSATGSSGASSRASTARRAPCASWAPGGRRASDPGDEGGFVPALRRALAAYLRFAGASRLEWAAHLGSERRLIGVRPRET